MPSYLRGAVPIGAPHGDIQRMLALQNANPFQTVQQLGQAAGAVVGAGSPQAGAQSALGMVSPFIATPFDYLSRAARGEAKGGLGPAYQDFLASEKIAARFGGRRSTFDQARAGGGCSPYDRDDV
jgi:hypothetical protein